MASTSRKPNSAGRVVLGLMTLAGAVTSTKAASRPGVGVAQPTNYVSPSGAYTLFVDPADRRGRGAASYRLSKDGVEVWSGEKPYALREVSVTDPDFSDGLIAMA